jgi:hypothetical protein
MACTTLGPYTWHGERDDEGHRSYHIAFKVKSTDPLDGPFTVLLTPGLPRTGDLWVFGNDADCWAWCHPQTTIRALSPPGHPTSAWLVERMFSTKPIKRCQDKTVEDPLLEPQKISGNFVKYTEEARFDRKGYQLLYSSFEQISGPHAEFDANRHTIKVEQNVADLQLPLISGMNNTVNDATLWGVPKRCIKLSDVGWERVLWGTCTYYFKRNFTFEIRMPVTLYSSSGTGEATGTVPGWDRMIQDKGSRCVRGRWDTDIKHYYSPDAAENTYGTYLIDGFIDMDNLTIADMMQAKDFYGENTTIPLNGNAYPALHMVPNGEAQVKQFGVAVSDPKSDNVGQILVEKYDESDFTCLNIPLDFTAS